MQLDSVPLNVGAAWIERQVESALAICKHANVHHQTLIHQAGVACQMEQHRHVVPVVCGIETSDIDETVPQAVSEVAGV